MELVDTEPMLRIIHITGMTTLKYGGFERSMLAVSKQCAQRGYQCCFVWEAPPDCPQFVQDLAATGAQSVVIPAIGRNFTFLKELTGFLLRGKFNIMHTHFNRAALLGLVAAKLAGVPLSLSMLRSQLLPQEKICFPLKSRIVAHTRRALSTRILAVSEMVKQDYQQLNLDGGKIGVHYIGVPVRNERFDRNAVRQELELMEDDLVVACIAFHDPVKGVDIMLRALPSVIKEIPKLKVLQVGGARNHLKTESLMKLSQEQGLEPYVRWLGWRSDVPRILAAADVYCQPSRAEGMGLAILEAMSAELPIIATNVGGIPESVSQGINGLLTPPENSPALAASLIRLLADPDLRQRMGQASRKLVERRFDLEKQTDRLIDIYECMAGIVKNRSQPHAFY